MKLLHPQLDAYTLQFEDGLLDEIRASYRSEIADRIESPDNQYLFQGGRSHRVRIGPSSPYFASSFDDYPLLWFSNNNDETYAMFRRFFDALEIERELLQIVDCRERIAVYCGFLIIGDRAPETKWHCDYAGGANAFTMITPLYELAPDHGHLLYKLDGQSQHYKYTLNEAIFFGEKTSHTTEPYGPSDKKRVLLSLTFGTDKIEYWPLLKESLDSQSPYFRLPCGHVYGRCNCLKISPLDRLSRWMYQRLVPVSEIP